jgi:hypothetical protein
MNFKLLIDLRVAEIERTLGIRLWGENYLTSEETEALSNLRCVHLGSSETSSVIQYLLVHLVL